jgi:predicted aspartyl protease
MHVPEQVESLDRWGSGSIHRLRIPAVSELFGLGATTIPILPIVLSYKGKALSVRAGIDTGASNAYVVIDTSIAKKLDLPNYGGTPFRVLGGGKVAGYISAIDKLDFENRPECTFKNPPTAVMDLGDSERFGVLIGEDYLKRVGATISYLSSPPTIICSGGTLRWLDDPWSGTNSYLLMIGGLFLVGFLVSLSVDKN